MVALMSMLVSLSLCTFYGVQSIALPIHIKFRKVGSGTVSSFIREKEEYINISRAWISNVRCGKDSLGHTTLPLYRMHGTAGFKSCVTPGTEYKLLAVMRDPVEKLVSQLYFFRQQIMKSLSRRHDNTSSALLQIMERLASQSQDISVDDMKQVINTFHNWGDGVDQRMMVHEYSYVLCNDDVLDEEACLATAERKLDLDFSAVGTMDNMPSLLVLIGEVFGIDFESSCKLHVRHGADSKNIQYFGNSTRPRIEQLFHPNVVTYLHEEYRLDRAIYEYAKIVHVKKLQARGLTSAAALEKWEKTCTPSG